MEKSSKIGKMPGKLGTGERWGVDDYLLRSDRNQRVREVKSVGLCKGGRANIITPTAIVPWIAHFFYPPPLVFRPIFTPRQGSEKRYRQPSLLQENLSLCI